MYSVDAVAAAAASLVRVRPSMLQTSGDGTPRVGGVEGANRMIVAGRRGGAGGHVRSAPGRKGGGGEGVARSWQKAQLFESAEHQWGYFAKTTQFQPQDDYNNERWLNIPGFCALACMPPGAGYNGMVWYSIVYPPAEFPWFRGERTRRLPSDVRCATIWLFPQSSSEAARFPAFPKV